jgi:hypothetical protein
VRGWVGPILRLPGWSAGLALVARHSDFDELGSDYLVDFLGRRRFRIDQNHCAEELVHTAGNG